MLYLCCLLYTSLLPVRLPANQLAWCTKQKILNIFFYWICSVFCAEKKTFTNSSASSMRTQYTCTCIWIVKREAVVCCCFCAGTYTFLTHNHSRNIDYEDENNQKTFSSSHRSPSLNKNKKCKFKKVVRDACTHECIPFFGYDGSVLCLISILTLIFVVRLTHNRWDKKKKKL